MNEEINKTQLNIVGTVPGDCEVETVAAIAAIRGSDTVIDSRKYELSDEEICRKAVESAMKGQITSIILDGDSGIYGIAGLCIEIADELNADINIVPIAGVTAASSAAAALGAPLTQDFAVINFGDSATPLERTYRRVEMAAGGDFVICIYNPYCSDKPNILKEAFNIISRFRERRTPVGIVKNAGSEKEEVVITTIGKIDYNYIEKNCTVIIGNSQTYVKNKKMITPRGYMINGQ